MLFFFLYVDNVSYVLRNKLDLEKQEKNTILYYKQKLIQWKNFFWMATAPQVPTTEFISFKIHLCVRNSDLLSFIFSPITVKELES